MSGRNILIFECVRLIHAIKSFGRLGITTETFYLHRVSALLGFFQFQFQKQGLSF